MCKGHNIWPSQIEMVVMDHCEVDNCVVVAGEDPNIEHNHIPVAFIVLKDASTIDKNHFTREIDDFCRQRLPERDLAQRYEFIDAIPLTAVGKVDFRELEKRAKQK